MKTKIEAYKAWTPEASKWTQWAKPVLFFTEPRSQENLLSISSATWTNAPVYSSIVIADLPGIQGVEEGIALARVGYRPVPLYNCTMGPNAKSMVVKVGEIVQGLYAGAEELERLTIRSDAPPVFLLDANRMEGAQKEKGKFDNRWCVFPQDMPSGDFLLSNGINAVIVRSDEIRYDLSHILCRYQEKGIRIYLCDDGGRTEQINVSMPSRFRALSYRFKVIAGLTRNAAGGFGATIPEPMEHNSTHVHYGIG